ncbi:hypothetical protein A2U01_0090207, partial [Trifolium medium]|nr:hypothetical protein [Trifolium medium]
ILFEDESTHNLVDYIYEESIKEDETIGSDKPSSGTCSTSGTFSEVLMFPASEAFSL